MTTICRILCVDDEIGICRFLEQTLTLEDFEVTVFDDPVRALEYLEKHPDFAVIISDYRMPEIHGIEFLSRTRALAPTAVRIMLTAFGATINFNEAKKKVKLFNYLSKPISPDELIFQVERALEQYQMLTNETCRELEEEDEDWSEPSEGRTAAVLVCHLTGWDTRKDHSDREDLLFLPSRCYEIFSKFVTKGQGQTFTQEEEAAVAVFEARPDIPAAVSKALDAAMGIQESLAAELQAFEESGLSCLLVVSVGTIDFGYDDATGKQSLLGQALEQARPVLKAGAMDHTELILTRETLACLEKKVEVEPWGPAEDPAYRVVKRP